MKKGRLQVYTSAAEVDAADEETQRMLMIVGLARNWLLSKFVPGTHATILLEYEGSVFLSAGNVPVDAILSTFTEDADEIRKMQAEEKMGPAASDKIN
jgi:hypothetical protein